MGMFDYPDPGCDPRYCDNISDPPEEDYDDTDDDADYDDDEHEDDEGEGEDEL